MMANPWSSQLSPDVLELFARQPDVWYGLQGDAILRRSRTVDGFTLQSTEGHDLAFYDENGKGSLFVG